MQFLSDICVRYLSCLEDNSVWSERLTRVIRLVSGRLHSSVFHLKSGLVTQTLIRKSAYSSSSDGV